MSFSFFETNLFLLNFLVDDSMLISPKKAPPRLWQQLNDIVATKIRKVKTLLDATRMSRNYRSGESALKCDERDRPRCCVGQLLPRVVKCRERFGLDVFLVRDAQ